MSATPTERESPTAQKQRHGISRLVHAFGYSLEGLRAGWGEAALRQEMVAAVLLLPLAFWVGQSWLEVALLCGAVVLVLIVELINTGIETAIDRIGPEWPALRCC